MKVLKGGNLPSVMNYFKPLPKKHFKDDKGGLTNAYYEAKQKYRQDELQFYPDKNPNGNYILFMNAKAKWNSILKAYTVLGEVNEDGLH
eukprot:10902676-Ditylum_brightwellii.AAC.1